MSDNKYLEIQKEIESYGFTVVDKDFERPWGAFLVIDEQEALSIGNELSMTEYGQYLINRANKWK